MSNYTEVFAWGGDHLGQLGLAAKQTGKTYCVPRFCSFNVFIKQISCGEEHSAFIAQSGCVYTMGSNSEGRLGIGSRSVRQSASPCLVESLSSHPAEHISCGWGHTAVVCEGNVYAWGVGEYGALGIGSTETQWFPAQMRVPTDVTAALVSCGARHTAVLVVDPRSHRRTLLMTGAGEAGQLGTGKREKELIPVRVPFTEEVRQVSCGVFHTAFVTDSGRVYTMGGNSFGQLGLGTKKSSSIPARVATLDNVQITKVACGHHTGAVSDRGDLYLWGTGAFGEFLSPQAVTSVSTRFTDLDIGGSFGVALDSQNCLYAWGSNTNGELGLGDYEQRVTPCMLGALQGKRVRTVSCGGSFCIALGMDIGGSTLSSTRSLSKKQATPQPFPPPLDSLSPIKPVRLHQSDFPDKEFRRSQHPAERDFNRTKESARMTLDSTQRAHFEGDEPEMVEPKRKPELSMGELTRTMGAKDSFARRLEADHSRLLQLTKDMEVAIAAKEREIASLRSVNDRLTREKSEPKPVPDPMESSMLHRKIDALNASFEDLAAENQTKENEIAALRVAHERVANERDRFEVLLREKETALSLSRTISEKTTLTRKETEDLFRRKDSEIIALRSDMRAMEAALAAKDRDLAADRYKIEGISADKAKAENELSAAKAETSRILLNFDESQRKNADLKRELDTRDGEYARLMRELEAHRRDKHDLQTDLSQAVSASDNLQREKEDLKSLLDTRCLEITNLRRDVEAASQARSVLTTDYSKLIGELDACKQQVADLRSRLADKEADLAGIKQNFEAMNRDRNSLQQQIIHLENDLGSVLSAKEKLSVGLDLQLKATSQVKQNAEEHSRRLEMEMRRKEDDYMTACSKMRETLEAKIDQLNTELKEERMLTTELKDAIGALEGSKRGLHEVVQRGAGKAEELQREVEQLQKAVQAKEEHISRANIDCDEMQKREKQLVQTRDELTKELERVRVQAANAMQDFRALEDNYHQMEQQHAELNQENRSSKSSVEELKYEFEKLYQQHSDALKEMDRLQEMNEDLHDQYKRAQSQNEALNREITDLEAKNKELFRSFEQELATRARNFRERSLNALGTPSPMRPCQNASPLAGDKSMQSSGMKSTLSSTMRAKGESPAERYGGTVDFSRKISKVAERMMETGPSPLANMRITSPMRKQKEAASPKKKVEFSPVKNMKSIHEANPDYLNLLEDDSLPQFAVSLRGSMHKPAPQDSKSRGALRQDDKRTGAEEAVLSPEDLEDQ